MSIFSFTDKQPKTNEELFEASDNKFFNKIRNKFTINFLKYPLSLDQEGGPNKEFKHWINFNINVRGKSRIRLPNENITGEVRRDPDSAQISEDNLGRTKVAALTLSGGASGIAGGAAVRELADKFIGRNEQSGSGLAPSDLRKFAAVGAVAGFAANGLDFLQQDTSFRISDAISLYVSEPPAVKYNTQYSNKELGTLAGLIGAAAGGGSAAGSILSDLGEGGAAMAAKFAQLPQMFGASTADILGASAKVALNPFKEVLFESVDFRSFSFKYKFMPKNRKESDQVFKIIEKFKFHMHPELSANKLFFIYPSEFQISYHFGTETNDKTGNGYFHKFKPCVLESLDVTYGGDQFSSFRDGNPTEINLSLTFRETEILTKTQIAQGY